MASEQEIMAERRAIWKQCITQDIEELSSSALMEIAKLTTGFRHNEFGRSPQYWNLKIEELEKELVRRKKFQELLCTALHSKERDLYPADLSLWVGNVEEAIISIGKDIQETKIMRDRANNRPTHA